MPKKGEKRDIRDEILAKLIHARTKTKKTKGVEKL